MPANGDEELRKSLEEAQNELGGLRFSITVLEVEKAEGVEREQKL